MIDLSGGRKRARRGRARGRAGAVALLLLLAAPGCGTTAVAYRGEVLQPSPLRADTTVNVSLPQGVARPITVASGPGAGGVTAALALVEYREILVLDVLLYNHGPEALTLEPAMATLTDFSRRPFQYLPPHLGGNRFMAQEVAWDPFRPKADYWIPNVDYGYPHIPAGAAQSPEQLETALAEALASFLGERFAASPETVADLVYREGLTPGVVVNPGTTLRFNIAWRNYSPKFYPMELLLEVPGIRVRFQP